MVNFILLILKNFYNSQNSKIFYFFSKKKKSGEGGGSGVLAIETYDKKLFIKTIFKEEYNLLKVKASILKDHFIEHGN